MHYEPTQGRDTTKGNMDVFEPKDAAFKVYIGKNFDDYGENLYCSR